MIYASRRGRGPAPVSRAGFFALASRQGSRRVTRILPMPDASFAFAIRETG